MFLPRKNILYMDLFWLKEVYLYQIEGVFMFKKIAVVTAALFSIYAPFGYCGDLSDTIGAVKSIAEIKGNAAVGVNTGDLKLNSTAEGRNSVANAGLGVIHTSGAASEGKTINLAVGVNTKAAEIAASAKSGGTANAGLAVVHTKN